MSTQVQLLYLKFAYEQPTLQSPAIFFFVKSKTNRELKDHNFPLKNQIPIQPILSVKIRLTSRPVQRLLLIFLNQLMPWSYCTVIFELVPTFPYMLRLSQTLYQNFASPLPLRPSGFSEKDSFKLTPETALNFYPSGSTFSSLALKTNVLSWTKSSATKLCPPFSKDSH